MKEEEFQIKILSLKDKIFRLAKSMLGNIPEAEDLTQDVFERLWSGRNALGRQDNLDGYIMTSVKNRCIDRIRSNKLRSTGELIENTAYETTTLKEIDRANIKLLLEKLMAELPEKQRAILHLRDIEGYEFEEIAEIMEIDEPTVRVYLSRARKTLKDKMINKRINSSVLG